MALSGKFYRRASALTASILVGLSLAACSSTTPKEAAQATVSDKTIDAALKKPATIVYWSSLPGLPKAAAAFEKEYPAIHIDVENPSAVAGGNVQRLRTALQAGTGIPDAIDFDTAADTASFQLSGDLVNLSAYGASEFKSAYVSGAWKEVSFDNGIWGLPQDVAPVAMMYRKDLLAKAGVGTPPATWTEFAADAAKVKAATGSYMANFSVTEIASLVTQGAQPLTSWDGGKSITVALDNPDVKRISAFWQGLINKKLVSTDAAFTDPWYQGMAQGRYATWMAPAWGPLFLQGTASSSAGLWRVADLPQWTAGANAQISSGGSVQAILKSSKHPLATYAFIRWLNEDPKQSTLLTGSLGVFPATVKPLTSEAFLNQKSAFFGGQAVNAVFAKAAKSMTFAGLNPISTFTTTSMNDTVVAALANDHTLYSGYQAWQSAVVAYAKKEGLTVIAK